MNIKSDDICTFCNEERETIEHLFTECELVLVFFNRLKGLLLQHNIVNVDFKLNPEFILFGISENVNYTNNSQLQYVFLVAKYFVYTSRCEEILPVFASFLKYFAMKFETLKYIAMKNVCIDKFNREWRDFEFLLSDGL